MAKGKVDKDRKERIENEVIWSFALKQPVQDGLKGVQPLFATQLSRQS